MRRFTRILGGLSLAAAPLAIGIASFTAPASAAVTLTVRYPAGPENLPVSYTSGLIQVVLLPPDPCRASCISIGNLANITFLSPGPCSNLRVAGLPACRAVNPAS